MLWSDWYPYVRPELPGAPTPLLDHYILQAAIHFFEESQVWTESLTAINLVADTGTYTLTVPAVSLGATTTTADVSMVKWVWVDEHQVYPSSQEELGMIGDNWTTHTSAFVTNYTQLTQDTITLYPIPNYASTGGLKIKVAVRPGLTSTGVPDWLGQKYVQEIATRVKAEMMGMVNQPWTNAAGEQKYAAAYQSALTKATVEGNRSFTRTSMTVRFKKFVR